MQIYDIIDELPRGEGKIIYNGSTQKYGYHYHWIYKPSTEGGSGVVKDAYNSQEEVRVAYCEHRKSWMADAAMRHRRNRAILRGEKHE